MVRGEAYLCSVLCADVIGNPCRSVLFNSFITLESLIFPHGFCNLIFFYACPFLFLTKWLLRPLNTSKTTCKKIKLTLEHRKIAEHDI